MTGNVAIWSHFLDELLGLMVQQKRLILSDKNFLASFMTSLLGSSLHGFLVPQNIEQRYTFNANKIVDHHHYCSSMHLCLKLIDASLTLLLSDLPIVTLFNLYIILN